MPGPSLLPSLRWTRNAKMTQFLGLVSKYRGNQPFSGHERQKLTKNWSSCPDAFSENWYLVRKRLDQRGISAKTGECPDQTRSFAKKWRLVRERPDQVRCRRELEMVAFRYQAGLWPTGSGGCLSGGLQSRRSAFRRRRRAAFLSRSGGGSASGGEGRQAR